MSIDQLIKKSRGDTIFFRSAYMWMFQKDGNVWVDVLEYRKSGKVPLYVTKYAEYIDSLDSEGAHGF